MYFGGLEWPKICGDGSHIDKQYSSHWTFLLYRSYLVYVLIIMQHDKQIGSIIMQGNFCSGEIHAFKTKLAEQFSVRMRLCRK
jgi:hypothetical protein